MLILCPLNPYAAGGWFGQYKMMQKIRKMTQTLANGYSYESAQRELSNEYQHDRVQMVIKNLCVIVLGMKVALALEGLKLHQKRNDKQKKEIFSKISEQKICIDIFQMIKFRQISNFQSCAMWS